MFKKPGEQYKSLMPNFERQVARVGAQSSRSALSRITLAFLAILPSF